MASYLISQEHYGIFQFNLLVYLTFSSDLPLRGMSINDVTVLGGIYDFDDSSKALLIKSVKRGCKKLSKIA